MALHATKHIVLDKSVYYTCNAITGTWSSVSEGGLITTINTAYEHHRYCTQMILWVGCSESDAMTLKTSLTSQYTRNVSGSEWSNSNNDFVSVSMGQRLMADVSMSETRGHMYTVTLNVREEDVIVKKSPAPDCEILFSTENNRSYQ